MHGDYAAVGIPNDDEDANGSNPLNAAGTVIIYHRETDGTWVQSQRLEQDDRAQSANFGRHVQMTEDQLFVGTWFPKSIQIFTLDPCTGLFGFTHQITDELFSISTVDDFGSAFSIWGDRMAVGVGDFTQDSGPYAQDVGAVEFFRRQPGSDLWNYEGYLLPETIASDVEFGKQVLLGPDFLAVGAEGMDTVLPDGSTVPNSGAVFIYERDDCGNFVNPEVLFPDGPAFAGSFPNDLATDGRFLVLGHASEWEVSNYDTYASGAVYCLDMAREDPIDAVQKYTMPTISPGQYFGQQVAVSAGRIVTSTQYQNIVLEDGTSIPGVGQVHTLGWDESDQTWKYYGAATSGTPQNSLSFGADVSLCGDDLMVGAVGRYTDNLGNNIGFLAGGVEFLEFSTDPCLLDSDNDGISDCDETDLFGTDPFSADSDGDGLSDRLEINTSLTDPLNPDTDGDGCDDASAFSLNCPDSVCNPCPADLDGDALVGTNDLLLMLAFFGAGCD